MSIKVLLVDDQAMVRAGIHMILEVENDIRVVSEAEDGSKAIMLVHKLKPDVVLTHIMHDPNKIRPNNTLFLLIKRC